MSFQAMTWAVEQKIPAQQKIVLLMLANRTNHDTGRCDPSHKRLADDCGMSADSVKRAIKSLEASGHISIVGRAVDGVRLPNQYLLNLHGVGANSTEGWVPTALGVGADSTIKQEFKQEDKTKKSAPSADPNRTKLVTFNQWLDSLADEEMAIRDDDPVYAFAESAGIPDEFISLAWSWFADSYSGDRDEKKYADWRKVFRNSVKGNWAKFWYPRDDGGYGLTSAGETFRRAVAGRAKGSE